MRRIYNKDRSSRQYRFNVETLTRLLGAISADPRLPSAVRINARMRLNAAHNLVGGVRNVCLESSRSRGVFRHFRISRIKLRELGSLGYLPGLRKQ